MMVCFVQTNEDGMTAIALAAQGGWPVVVQLLLDTGADPAWRGDDLPGDTKRTAEGLLGLACLRARRRAVGGSNATTGNATWRWFGDAAPCITALARHGQPPPAGR